MTPARDDASPAAVVQRQLDAYNRHDLDAFMATYRHDAKVWRMPSSTPALDGADAIRAFYRDARFNLPVLHAELIARSWSAARSPTTSA